MVPDHDAQQNMKKKYITDQEYFDNVRPDTQVGFGTVSPFATLNFPPDKTVFIALYGNISFGSGPSIAIGTLEACRYGEGAVVYDFDRYPIYTTGTPFIYEIVGPQKPPYHWSSDIPPHLRSQTPQSLTNSSCEER